MGVPLFSMIRDRVSPYEKVLFSLDLILSAIVIILPHLLVKGILLLVVFLLGKEF
jgi:hypothetical protein